jgi:hypothetical protein
MHDIYELQRTRESHPRATPGQGAHGWRGGIHDGRTNSLSLRDDQDAKQSAEVTEHQLRGFMVAARGVHGGDRAAIFTGPVPRALTAARSAVRSPAPSLPRTSAHRLPPHGGSGVGRSPGSPSSRPGLPGGGAFRSSHSGKTARP